MDRPFDKLRTGGGLDSCLRRNDGLGAGPGDQTTNSASFGRELPPCTDGSAHHLAASRRTLT